MKASEASEGDRVKIASYARWLKVVTKHEDGSLFVVHGGTQFVLEADDELAKHEAAA